MLRQVGATHPEMQKCVESALNKQDGQHVGESVYRYRALLNIHCISYHRTFQTDVCLQLQHKTETL